MTSKPKDYEPIKFEIFQSDMERIMYQLKDAIYFLSIDEDNVDSFNCGIELEKIKNDFQHKIDIHKERGEWI
jgi:hypothetical protein